tara:strand:+ start:217 stop:474 length:258 start_codon:yes stop_codon:yes gene_type:complete
MSEKYDFKIFNNALKKEFLLNQIFELEVQLFGLHVAEVPDGHPEFVDWKYAFDECLKQLNKIRNKYEELGGDYDIQEIRNVINNS